MGRGGFFDYDGSEAEGGVDPFDFLPQFTESQWQTLLDYTHAERYDAGQFVFEIGEKDRALFIIGEGQVEVLGGSRNRLKRIALSDKGDVIGEQVFLDGQARSASVRALTSVSLLKLGFDAFEAFAASYPDLARMVLLDLGRIVSLRLRATTALLLARR